MKSKDCDNIGLDPLCRARKVATSDYELAVQLNSHTALMCPTSKKEPLRGYFKFYSALLCSPSAVEINRQRRCWQPTVSTSTTQEQPKMSSSNNPFNSLGPEAQGSMSSVIALVTGLVKSVPNEEFGVLMRWMNEESNRRRDHVRMQLAVGTSVVWVNTTGKLTHGEVVEIGAKNAKVRSQHGGELFVPLARLELASTAAARMSSLPPPVVLSSTPTAVRPRPPAKATLPSPALPVPPLAEKNPSVKKAKSRIG